MKRAIWKSLLLLVLCLLPGCGYPTISEKAYQHATALYGICNRKDEKRLAKYEQILKKAEAQGEISAQEAEWFNDIVKQARSGDWEDATSEAWEMLAANAKEK